MRINCDIFNQKSKDEVLCTNRVGKLGCLFLLMLSFHTFDEEVYTNRVQRYGSEGSRNSCSKMAYNSVREAYNCFSMKVITDVI